MKLFWNLAVGLAVLVNTLLSKNITLAVESPVPVASQNVDSLESVSSLEQINQHTLDTTPLEANLVSQSLKEAKNDATQATSQQAEFLAIQTAAPDTIILQQVDQYIQNTAPQAQVDAVSQSTEDSQDTDASNQVTSVSQLSDVQPTDWAFQALQSLVERYGCIAGYPDGTYRGNRALTRYEFAAGVNACLDRVNELIATATADLLTKQDLATLQRLQEEFAAELTTLRGRVDAVEAGTAELEANQFSTTTKLSGEIVTYLGNAFGENASDINNTDFGYRARIFFDTSFNGKDRLRTRLQATNLRLFDTGATRGGSLGVDDNGNPIFGQTGETRVTPSSVSQNSEVFLSYLEYRLPVGDHLKLYFEAGTIDPTYVTDPISPFVDTATGAISNFGQVNPAYFPIGNRAGFGANLIFNKAVSLDVGYFGEDTTEGGPNNPGRDSGIFNGGYSAFGQLTFSVGGLKLGLFYENSFSPRNGVDTLAGSNAAKVIGAGPVVGNTYSAQFNYRLFSGLEVGGWAGYTAARSLGGGTKGDASVWNYAVTLNFPDLFRKGNQGGIVVGVQPRLTGTSNSTIAEAIGLPFGQRKDRDTGLHVEAFYRYNLTDNISITPGVFWLTAPNHNDRNPDTVIGIIRTTFLF